MAKDPKEAIAIMKENSKCQWGHWPFLLMGESVATPFWAKCGGEAHTPKSGNVATPLWAKCEGEAHTPKSGNLESSGTPENSDLELKGQNTSHWGVLSVIGKVLKCRCLNWPCIGHFDICSPSYGQKKGRESNWQFDSRPQKFGNRPLPNVRL
jgi:hypothetical protein